MYNLKRAARSIREVKQGELWESGVVSMNMGYV